MKKIIYGFLIILLIGLLYVGYWLETPYKALDSVDTKSYTKLTKEYISYNIKESTEGIIIYPGGRVEEEAYIPLAKELYDRGYTTIIARMPFNLAVLDLDRADKIINKHSNIKKWHMVGHSLGGSMAAKYVYDNPNIIKSLILLASYPPESSDLSNTDTNILSISATKDSVINKDKLIESKYILPKDTKFISITGGNHSQFGSYGLQNGDTLADISPSEQREIVVKEIIDFIKDKN